MVLAMTLSQAQADNINEFLGTVGDGSVLVDVDEGVLAPGITIITGNSGNNAAFTGYDGTDFIGNGFSQQNNENCIRSSVAGAACDDPQKSGKRDKILLTGPGPLDLLFNSTDTNDGITDYLAISKVSNTTGARMIGYQVQIGYGTGNDFQLVSVAGNTNVQFDNLLDKALATNPNAANWAGSTTTFAQSPLQRTFYAAGLFGLEGQDTDGDGTNDTATVGFFTPDQRVALLFNPDDPVQGNTQEQLNAGAPVQFDLATGTVTGTTYADNFGADSSIVPLGIAPQGILWDNDNDPSTDGVLMAAYLNGQWVTYRAWDAATEQFIVVDPSTIAGLGIPAGGALVPDPTGAGAGTATVLTQAQVNALLANSAYSQDVVEDISKVNLNFGIDISNLDGFNNGQFTIRIVPIFAPVVEAAENDYQFDIAANLDFARVPYLGLDSSLATLATAIEALPSGQRAAAIEETGFGFLSAFDTLTQSAARNQMDNTFFRIDGSRNGSGSAAIEGDLATNNGPDSHAYTDKFSVFFTGGALLGNVDRDGSSRGFDYNSYAGTFGADVKVNETFIVGAAGGYTYGNADIDGNIGSLDAHTYSVLGYFGANWGNGLYLDGTAGYAYTDYDSVRRTSIAATASYSGSTQGHSIMGRVQTGYNYSHGGWRIGPVGDFSFVNTSVDGFTESGGGTALRVDSQDLSSVQAGIGINSDYRISQSWGALMVRGKALIVHDFADEDRITNTSFVGGLATGWDTPSTNGFETFAALNAGASAVFDNGGAVTTAVGLDYNGSIGDGAQEHRGTLSLKVRW
jgi:uncharacterized protein YhjY with autotransporter beta-barrel domain